MSDSPALVPMEIEKLVYGGDGLARLPADEKGRRMAAFVPFTLPGEQVDAAIVSRQGGLVRAEAKTWRQQSPRRVTPECPYFGTCGGCHLQHGSYELQLAAKRDILHETFARAGLTLRHEIEVVAGAQWGYRNRIRLQVHSGPEWRVGYLQRRSHKFLPVDECPIAALLLQRAIRALTLPEVAAHAPANVAELELFCNHDQSQLLLTAWASKGISSNAFTRWTSACREQAPQLSGASALTQASVNGGFSLAASAGIPQLIYRVANEDFRVSSGAFFQTNLHLLDTLAQLVTTAVPDDTLSEVLDLYAGAGLFSRLLARRGARVTAVESSPASAADLNENLREFPLARAVTSSSEDFLRRTSIQPSAVVVDPPRAGLGKEAAQQLARMAAPVLVYLSCDPATLARDLKPLLDAGYEIQRTAMIDLFPQTFHIETLVVLRHN
jgi:23S rRNA (uracil1939-C5)-methyltransferase